MRLIDADLLKEDLSRFYDGLISARELIDSQPTVELLKEQQPRVLSYKEAMELETGTDIWMEFRNSNWTCCAFTFISFTKGHIYKWFNFYGSQNRQCIHAMRYGSSIRFWTRQPTREQMQNTPWKGGEQE